MAAATQCPHCGTEIPHDGWEEGLCPACILGLALSPIEVGEEIEAEDLAPDEPAGPVPANALAPGRVLGSRYRIRSLLGRGGMGEVWRGYDLKLRVDVALKVVREDLPFGGRTLELVRREVRLAREVSSPNVCRVFDLVEVEGRELVCMEYVDGVTLAELLRERGPLAFDEAQEMASQFLAGLAAVHRAGLVHRDLKPENLMLTRAGRVVVMDLGIAHWASSLRPGTFSGTPPYMSPEQARGEAVDARADVFAAGVMLAEMVEPGGVASEAARSKVWRGIGGEPPGITETAWAPVIRKAVAADRERRYESAFALARALEEVTLRAVGAEDARPFPGLASFGAQDAAFFFGREVEVEALWRKLRRPGLFGLIGPSGVGKSSFLRAGLLPARPEGWSAVVTTPGDRPFAALAQALLPELGSDRETLADLLRFEDADVAVPLVARWRRRHDQALVVVDQFEELFTQNSESAQEAYVRLLQRFALEADAHVLLAMRDDFLFQCHRFEALQPIFAELTPLGAPTGAALRRAIVQPALKCGYRFEDEALVEAIIVEVQGERGALPLLAFACAELWERRDRERGALTRAAYEEIGGVAGALAQHAEATLETIGRDRLPLVREIFRNLVTAQGTRAARDRAELLSVFSEENRNAVAGILDALVASRLVVSYEAHGEARAASSDVGGRGERVLAQSLEIVHESLLTKWPRLVQWRAQDQEAAILRDQLRDAARLWERHHRADDFVWSGTAYREFELWRERYPGGLTALEESFADAMTALAQRRRRRRRLAASALVALLAAGLTVFGALWRKSEASRERAEAEARRAEASKLLALGQVELENNPTAALAYAIKSLELADSHAARLFALRALAAGPPAVLHTLKVRGPSQIRRVSFSPDGAWAAVAGTEGLHVVSRTGGPGRILDPFPSGTATVSAVFDPASEHLFAAKDGVVKIWRVPAFALVETQAVGGSHTWLRRAPSGVFCTTRVNEKPREVELSVLVVGQQPRRLGRFEGAGLWDLHPATSSLAFARDESLFVRSLGEGPELAHRVGRFGGQPTIRFHPTGDRVAAYASASREIGIWAANPPAEKPLLALPAPFEPLADFSFDPAGERLAAIGLTPRGLRVNLWDLDAPVAAAAWSFPATFGGFLEDATFSPDGRWLATTNRHAVCFWPLPRREHLVLLGHRVGVSHIKFTPDGGRIVSVDRSGEVREWHLGSGGGSRVLAQANNWSMLDVDARGRFLVVAQQGGALLVPLDGGEPRALRGFAPATELLGVTIDSEGRRVAAASMRGPKADKVIRVWDLETGQVRVLGPTEQAGEGFVGQTVGLRFLTDGSLVSAGEGGLRLWSLSTGAGEVVAPSFVQSHLTVLSDGHSVAYTVAEWREGRTGDPAQAASVSVAVTDLSTRTTRILRSHGPRVMPVAVDPSGTVIVSGGHDGIVRVGPVSGEEPHLLIGHEGWVHSVAVSPDGRWIASTGDDRTIRLWPMPDLAQRPLHTLPRDQLLSKLESMTNVRVVEESASTISAWLKLARGSGYELDLEPFPGWKEVSDL